MALQPNGERPPNQQYAVIPRTPWRYRNRDICRRYRDGWPNAKITSVACAASRVRTPTHPLAGIIGIMANRTFPGLIASMETSGRRCPFYRGFLCL